MALETMHHAKGWGRGGVDVRRAPAEGLDAHMPAQGDAQLHGVKSAP